MSEEQERKGTRHVNATVVARTARGGGAKNDSGIRVTRLPLACVGDIVMYNDGSEAVTIDGVSAAAAVSDQPAALIGSRN